MTPEEKKIIAEVVNSQEAVDMVVDQFHENWTRLSGLVEQKIDRSLTEREEDSLYRDLRDWWKNGNFHVWVEGEESELFPGLTKWELGDPDFWEDDESDEDRMRNVYIPGAGR